MTKNGEKEKISKFAKFRKVFYVMFRVPDTIVCFLSGVLVSAAINILTSPLPEKKATLPAESKLSVGLLLLASLILIILASIQKECQESFRNRAPNTRDWNKELEINQYGQKLTVLFLLFVVSFAIGIVLLFI